MLTTTIVPTAGTARLAGHDVSSDALAARAVASVVFQEAVVDAGLTGRRHLELHARLWGTAATEVRGRVDERIEALALDELVDRPVGTYSGGQRRRLEIARALVSRPEVLFLDEPTVGLDPRIRHELLDVIAALSRREGMTILLTTHYLEEAQRLCDRVAIMHEGRIVALGTPAALLADLGDELLEVRVERDAAATLERLRAHGVAGDAAFVVGATLTIPLGDGASAGGAIAALDQLAVPTAAIATRTPTLDDVYLRYTGAQLAEVA
jgi:ABC-2 type transport system ATP-binding protein